METTIVRLKSNGAYWQATWRVGRKVQVKSLGAKAKITKRAALKKCRQLEIKYAVTPEAAAAGRSPSLEGWTEHYLKNRKGIRATTLGEYKTTIKYLTAHFTGAIRINRITRADAAAFRSWLHDQGLSEQTICKHISNTKCIFGEAKKTDIVMMNPFDRQVSARPAIDNDWHYVTHEELDKVLEACPSTSWQAVIGLARLAGLRLNEITSLQWAGIDLEKRVITIKHEGKRTTKQRKREVPMVQQLHDILVARFDDAEPDEKNAVGLSYYWLNGTSRGYKDFKTIVKRAGFEMWSKPFHTLRKNRQTDWLADYPAMDVCRWLGNSVVVAEKHYHQTKQETMAAVTGVQEDERDVMIRKLQAEVEQLKKSGKGTK